MWLLLLYFSVVTGLLDNVGLPDTTLENRVQTIMEELLRLERDVADLKQSNTALTQSNNVLTQSNNVLTQSNNVLTQGNNALASEIATLKSKDEGVAFFAHLVDDLVNPSTGQTVIFRGVDTNAGNAYDPIHGVFVAPISGTYHFTLVASNPPAYSHAIHLFMKKNDRSNQMYLFLDGNNQEWLQRSTSSVLHLNKGERVWIEVGLVVRENTLAGFRAIDGASHTHFSGFLIHAD